MIFNSQRLARNPAQELPCGLAPPTAALRAPSPALCPPVLPALQARWAAGGVGPGREPPQPPMSHMSHSSSSSTERQSPVVRGAPRPAQHGPPVQPQRVGDAHGYAPWGGARGAHPGTAVHHCSVSKGINKCLGRSLGQRGFCGLGSGRRSQRVGAPAGQAPPDHPRVRVAGLQLNRLDL